MQGCSQLHAHGHPLVSKPRAEPALPPPEGGSSAFVLHGTTAKVHKWATQEKGNTCLNLVWLVVVVVVVVVQAACRTHVSVDMRQRDAPNWVAEHLGASSRRPRHPFPALMAGETPGRVTCVHGPKKAFPSRQELQLRRTAQFLHVWTP